MQGKYTREWYEQYDPYNPDAGKRHDAEGRLRYSCAMAFLESWLASQEGKRILQVGAGTGVLSLYFARKYPRHEFIATDLNPISVAFMNEKCRAERLLNVTALEFDIRQAANRLGPLGRLDAIFSHAVFLYLAPAEFRAFLQAKRDLLPEALLVITENCVVWRTPPDYLRWPMRACNKLFKRFWGGRLRFETETWEVGLPTNLPNNRSDSQMAAWSHNWFTIEKETGCEKLLHQVEYYSTPERILRSLGDNKMLYTLSHSIVLR